MSETPAVYDVDQFPIGYMPLPEVYAALDYVLGAARGQPPESATAAFSAGHAFLLAWFQAGALPSSDTIEQIKASMSEQVGPLTEAFGATLQAFVDQLDNHPCPLPGTAFGDYYADLVQLQEAAQF